MLNLTLEFTRLLNLAYNLCGFKKCNFCSSYIRYNIEVALFTRFIKLIAITTIFAVLQLKKQYLCTCVSGKTTGYTKVLQDLQNSNYIYIIAKCCRIIFGLLIRF